MTTKVLVVVPTYNESESIRTLLDRIGKVRNSLADRFALDLLIVDDNSPDKTSDIVQSLNLNWVNILRKPKKSGLGPAYLSGFKWGLDKGYEKLMEMDADLSHQPEQISDLLAAAKTADLVIGTRWMPGGKVENWPAHRQLISKAGTKYASIMLRMKYKDLTSGFRVLDSQFLRSLNFDEITTKGYGFQIEMALIAFKKGFKIAQVPITFIERAQGRSKMTLDIVFEAWKMVTIWGLTNRR
jgi:dolichol-phosphate mannosyltransferase